MLGPIIANRYGWHNAFFVVGVPGLLAALVVLFLPEPVRGASEGIDPERLREHQAAGATREDYVNLMVNSSYTYSVFGMSAYTFAIGGMLIWIPPYLYNTRAFDQERASMFLAGVTFAAAVIGMMTGGWVADQLARTRPQALFLVPGVAMLASIPFVIMALMSKRAGDLRLDLRGRDLDVRQHRAVHGDHRQRGPAQPPGGCPGDLVRRGPLPGRHWSPC